MMPRRLLIGLFVLTLLPFLGSVFEPTLLPLSVWMTVGIVVLALLDVLVSPRPIRIVVERETSDVMSVGALNMVKLHLHNQNSSSVLVQVHDEPPLPGDLHELPATTRIGPRQSVTLTYHVRPHHRGRGQFGTVFLRMRSRLFLWTLSDERELPADVRIFPDIRAIHGVELLARHNRLSQAGVRLSRLQGRGTDFDRLREYRRGDEYRCIDWKATAKHREVVSREYVVEKNQNVLFVLDAGRSMCNQVDGISHFDRALNAAILMSYVALRQGDSISLLCCGKEVQRWIPTLRGAPAIQSLVRQCYDLEASYDATDYSAMVKQVRQRQRKRSLVVLLTHSLDDVHLNLIGNGLRQMRRPHLVLGAFLRNVPLDDRVNMVPTTALGAFQIAAATEMLRSQSEKLTELEHAGLMVIDSRPDQLSSQLINQYLDIKARHLL